MTRWHILPISLLALPLFACDGGKATLDPAEREALKQEIKAEVVAELEESAAARRQAPPPIRPALSEGERAAIAAARERNKLPAEPAEPATDAPGDDAPLGDAPPEAFEPAGLEPADTAALADDPAANGSAAADAPDAGATAEPDAASAEAREVRPGARVWDTPSPVELIDLAVATGIADREPQGISLRYETTPELFFCYTVFDSRDSEATVTHVWRRGSRLVSKVELEVGKSPRWRTWSRQRTRPEWGGPWSCEVLDPDGKRLGLATFEVAGGS